MFKPVKCKHLVKVRKACGQARLSGNPVCSGSAAPSNFCAEFNGSDANITSPTHILVPPSCSADTCDASHNQELHFGLLASFNICQCAYPLHFGYRLKSPSFALYQPHERGLQSHLSSALTLLEHQVNASDFNWEPGPRLALNIKLFPPNRTGGEFTSSEVLRLYNRISMWNFSANRTFGPYELLYFSLEFPYNGTAAAPGSRSGLKSGEIAGIVIGIAAFAALIVAAVIIIIAKRKHNALPKKRQDRQHVGLKIDGVKDYSFEEMTRATNNFETQIGQGGYGMVYKASFDGVEFAIKRAHKGSLQGGKQFSTEIEMLSRVHHRNLVDLKGFCDDEDEQMLIYEYMENGTLQDHLKSTSRPPLDFATRLQIAWGSARGILYLHTEADPPIFHRDIKASNILLDRNMRAKVADFGISTLAPDELDGAEGQGDMSSFVQGTPGYLDPEYFLTRKLTDKSDVYSFGVVLLELITGKQPIYQGKNLVRQVMVAHKAGMGMSLVDQRMDHNSYPSECVELLLTLAINCCKDATEERPSMGEVVKEIERIWQMMPQSGSKANQEAFPELITPPRAVEKRAGAVGLDYEAYVSRDTDNSGLVSGHIPSVAPR